MTLAAQARYQRGRRRNLKRVDYLLLLFVGSVTGMGKVLSATKALGLLSGLLSAGLASFLKHPMGTPFGLFWCGFVYHLFLASGISMLGTSLPTLMSFAAAQHLNPLAVGMLWTFRPLPPSLFTRTQC